VRNDRCLREAFTVATGLSAMIANGNSWPRSAGTLGAATTKDVASMQDHLTDAIGGAA
jgi:hypothetical protein